MSKPGMVVEGKSWAVTVKGKCWDMKAKTVHGTERMEVVAMTVIDPCQRQPQLST